MYTVHIKSPDAPALLPVEMYATHAAIGAAVLAYWDYRLELLQWACRAYGVEPSAAALVLPSGEVLEYEALESEMFDEMEG